MPPNIVLTVGELRQILATVPDTSHLALTCKPGPTHAADDLRAPAVDLVRDGLVIVSPPPADVLAFFEAVARNDEATVARFLDAGIDVDSRDPRSPIDDGATALTMAAEGGMVGMVRLLLARGANVNARSATGYTASDRIHGDERELLELLAGRETR